MQWFVELRRPLQYAILAFCELVCTGTVILLITSSANNHAAGPGAWLFENEIAARTLTAALYVIVFVATLLFAMRALQIVDNQRSTGSTADDE